MTQEEVVVLCERIAALARKHTSMNKAAAEEFGFHLTDWLDDLRKLHAIFHADEWADEDAALSAIVAFVTHVPAHAAAAHRIWYNDPVKDVFCLGSVEGAGVAQRVPGSKYPEG